MKGKSTTSHGPGPQREEHDVVIIGGGPAGCSAAALLAEMGHDVLVLEREQFPRYRPAGKDAAIPFYQEAQRAVCLRFRQSLSAVLFLHPLRSGRGADLAGASFGVRSDADGTCAGKRRDRQRGNYCHRTVAKGRSRGGSAGPIKGWFDGRIPCANYARLLWKRILRGGAKQLARARPKTKQSGGVDLLQGRQTR